MNLIEKYHQAFERFSENEAFFDGKKRYSYREFSEYIQKCRNALEQQPEFEPGNAVGVIISERAETYAAVFAIWFAGACFVPLHPLSPKEFNAEIIRKHNIRIVFSPIDSEISFSSEKIQILQIAKGEGDKLKPAFPRNQIDILYILNTSGSTGTPKNVPINLKNIEAFIEGFLELYPELNESDKFLQTYDLTADAAFTGYLVPLLVGAATYTVPVGQFKPFQVAKVLSENHVTWVQVTPSLLACLQPFFQSMWFPAITHFHFGGEALPASLAEMWREHVPNAEISNVYGPTETTITATIYKCLPNESLKSKNNVVSIGKPLKNVQLKIVESLAKNEIQGELFIAGPQVMENYLFTDKQPFDTLAYEGKSTKFYPSGDWVETDVDGFLYYKARKDDQIKINGYRVDLKEVENRVQEFAGGRNTAAIAVEVSQGLKQLIVFIENYEGESSEILGKLSKILPFYKIPEKIIRVDVFPLTNSGKTDRKKLAATYQKTH